MKILVKLLLNTATTTYHPIVYQYYPRGNYYYYGKTNRFGRPHNVSEDDYIRCYQYWGHNIDGIISHSDAVGVCNEVAVTLQQKGYLVRMEIDEVQPWTGEDAPNHNQYRPY